MKIKITTDSTCDLTPALLQQYQITVVPLQVTKGEHTYTDGVDITPADIFEHVAAGGELCSTAAVNMATYRGVFETYAASYDAVIHISLGSGFSSCYQNACAAATGLSNVYTVDSMNLSTGQGFLAVEAAERAADCTDPAQLAEDLRQLTARLETSFLLNRLDYMVKGGRCSMVTALGANLLRLRPCIEVKNGKMVVVKKYRGTYEKCLAQYVRDRLKDRTDVVRGKLFVTYTPVEENERKAVLAEVKAHGHFSRVMETNAGCTISCHCGPETLGVLFLRK